MYLLQYQFRNSCWKMISKVLSVLPRRSPKKQDINISSLSLLLPVAKCDPFWFFTQKILFDKLDKDINAIQRESIVVIYREGVI